MPQDAQDNQREGSRGATPQPSRPSHSESPPIPHEYDQHQHQQPSEHHDDQFTLPPPSPAFPPPHTSSSSTGHKRKHSSGSSPKSTSPTATTTTADQHAPIPSSSLPEFDETPLEANTPISATIDEAYEDEVYGSAEESDTETLPAEVLNYRYLNGRRYHAFRCVLLLIYYLTSLITLEARCLVRANALVNLC